MAAKEASDVDATAKQIWNALLTKCGDSHYYAGSLFNSQGDLRGLVPATKPHQTEYKSARFAIVPIKLTEAQKLNGVEYIGRISMVSSVYRTKINDKWSAWVDGPAGRNVQEKEDIWNHVMQDFMGDGLGMGTGGAMALKIAKIKGQWVVARQGAQGQMVMGDKFFALAQIAPHTLRYDCKTGASNQPGSQAPAEGERLQTTNGHATLQNAMAPVRDPKKGIGFIRITPDELALFKTFSGFPRGAALTPEDRAKRNALLPAMS